MNGLFKYGRLSTKSSIERDAPPKKKYGDYKAEIVRTLKRHIELVDDPERLVKRGKNKDLPYIMELSAVSDDLSVIELTLRCGRKLFDFGQKNEKYFRYIVPVDAREEAQVKSLRLELLNELLQRVEADEYKAQIKAYIRRQAKEGFDRIKDGWYCG
ncbi:MAG: hypothetical protein ACU841_04370 [Gammaproteobacteria bacterium]